MFFIVLRNYETIGYTKKKQKPMAVRLEAGDLLYRKIMYHDKYNRKETYSYRLYLDQEHEMVKNYWFKFSAKSKFGPDHTLAVFKKKRFYIYVDLIGEELEEQEEQLIRPLSMQDKQFAELLKTRYSRIRKKHPDKSKKQIKWWTWRSLHKELRNPWGKDVEQPLSLTEQADALQKKWMEEG